MFVRHVLAATFLFSAVAVAGCSDTDEVGFDEAEVGRRMWTPPEGIAAIGRNVRLEYDAAPLWSGPSACAGRLREGTRELGMFLRDQFPAIETVGGYACRRNTADRARMSVHGTGRALDLMIPKRAGNADWVNGDPIANFLVQHAQDIGVQLIIWNRTIWRANGTNPSRYRGPHPHDDHIHVELTNEAARRDMPWFERRADAGSDAATTDEPMLDGGMTDASAEAEAPPPPPPPPPTVDAGPTPPPPPVRVDAGADEEKGEEGSAPQDPGGFAPGYEWEIPEGEPAPDDALGPQSRRRHVDLEEEEYEEGGCSVSATPGDASHGGAAGLAAIATVAFVSLRRRRR